MKFTAFRRVPRFLCPSTKAGSPARSEIFSATRPASVAGATAPVSRGSRPASNSRLYHDRPQEEIFRANYPTVSSSPRTCGTRSGTDAGSRPPSTARVRNSERASPGPKSHHVLSALLICAVCSGNMPVSGGSPAAYYRCTGAKKRGIGSNKLSQREDVAVPKILRAVREILTSPRDILELRGAITEKLKRLSDARDRDLRERQARLEVVETKSEAWSRRLARASVPTTSDSPCRPWRATRHLRSEHRGAETQCPSSGFMCRPCAMTLRPRAAGSGTGWDAAERALYGFRDVALEGRESLRFLLGHAQNSIPGASTMISNSYASLATVRAIF